MSLTLLHERGDKEKKALLNFFLDGARKEFKKPGLNLSRETQEAFIRYSFQGNVRELENLITSVTVFANSEVSLADLPTRLTQQREQKSESLNWKEVEKDLLIRALKHYKGNQRQAWQAVGYKSLNTFRNKLKKYTIET